MTTNNLVDMCGCEGDCKCIETAMETKNITDNIIKKSRQLGRGTFIIYPDTINIIDCLEDKKSEN